MAEASDDDALRARLRELMAAAPDSGFRALHASLQAEETFKGAGLKRVQKLVKELRESVGDDAPPAPAPGTPAFAAAAARQATPVWEPIEIVLSRPSLQQRFGMMIEQERSARGGHEVTEVRAGGIVAAWNEEHADTRISVGDVIVSVNGKTSFPDMMGEFGKALACSLKLLPKVVEDNSEAAKEKAAWEQRKARVTAALVPGLKKIVDHEFGAGASERIGRVDDLYSRIGRNEVHEEDTPGGHRYAPGYVKELSPVQPFHDTEDFPWCAELASQWKAIRKELKACSDSLWTHGAYASANSAYGKDWRILGVFTQDKWQDEKRFAVTSRAIKNLKGVTPSEAFFARMPPHTKIAPHSDNLNYIMTSHLALELEEGKCSIKVGNEERCWKEGGMIVFDTSYIHSTKNESDRYRYVLVLRFWHPGLTKEEQRALHLSHTILASAGQR